MCQPHVDQLLQKVSADCRIFMTRLQSTHATTAKLSSHYYQKMLKRISRRVFDKRNIPMAVPMASDLFLLLGGVFVSTTLCTRQENRSSPENPKFGDSRIRTSSKYSMSTEQQSNRLFPRMSWRRSEIYKEAGHIISTRTSHNTSTSETDRDAQPHVQHVSTCFNTKHPLSINGTVQGPVTRRDSDL